MAGKESNPIHQRIELLTEKWEVVIKNPDVSVVRINGRDNEKEMVDTFYTYLLGVDTDNHDIPIIFNSVYHSDEQYSKALLAELEEMIETWNDSDKSNVDVIMDQLDWKPDYNLKKSGNPAFLFIQNINTLAAFLKLPEGIHLVAILRVSVLDIKGMTRWLNFVLNAGVVPKVKLMIDDTFSHPHFQSFAENNPGEVATLVPDLNMDKAMQQLAAMGNPNDPGVQFRKAFTALMQAIEQRKEKDAGKFGAECIQIANSNLKTNPYWIGQVIAVNAALANDQVGYRNFKKAIEFSTKGVEASEKAKEIIPDEYIHRKFIAQAIMLRGSLYAASKEWIKAIEDFTAAANHYVYTNDMILAMEAYRMAGYSYNKAGDRDAACNILTEALAVSGTISPDMIRYTTFAGIIEHLFEINNQKYISNRDLEEIAIEVYGDDWMREIKNWKNPDYDQVSTPEKSMA
ncbi:MAG: tetratricopeptide repeat protein [Ferruginibacter sp.]